MNNPFKFQDLLFPMLISILILLVAYSNTVIQTKTKIVFCNVGQGDAIYIRTQDGIDLLIDAGPDQQAASCLGKYMPFYDRRIEYVFITHPQNDHYSGLFKINGHYQVSNLYLAANGEKEAAEFTKLIQQFKQGQTRINFLYQGDRLEINQHAFLNILWPKKDYATNNNSLLDRPDVNDLSLVMLFQENDFRLLLTGDISAPILERLLEKTKLHVDILKIPHHGSKYGINKNILRLAEPKTTVISVGKNNPHGHPAQEVIHLLQALKIKIKRTDIDGNVVILGK